MQIGSEGGLSGTYVLTSEQMWLDGKPMVHNMRPELGQMLVWRGEAVRLDGPPRSVLLGPSENDRQWKAKVAKAMRRRFDLPDAPRHFDLEAPEDAYLISDGKTRMSLIPLRANETDLWWCPDGLPVPGQAYFVARIPRENGSRLPEADSAGVICFTPSTLIRTPGGDRRVEDLVPGDLVLTRDAGPQEIRWISGQYISGARLHAMPHLRPVRLRNDALGLGRPEGDLLVSPDHKVLVSGPRAQDMYNCDEVLVAAKDMVNDLNIIVDHGVRDLRYIHLMFERHQILWAAGVPCESYHPADADLRKLDPLDRAQLGKIASDVLSDPYSYGPHARRSLSKAEAAILLHH